MPAIKFIKIDNEHPVIDYLFKTISSRLDAGQKVLWLVPGGSAIAIAAAVSHKLEPYKSVGLTISLTDERYGEIGHKYSNWQQLQAAGFSVSRANMEPVLIGESLETTAEHYDQLLAKAIKDSDYKLGFFGIGPDGHTAGLKPGSSSTQSDKLACGYAWQDYVRLTMTAKAIALLDEAVVYAVGEPKHKVLDELDKQLGIDEQPAQALKKVAKLTIFNDYKGESL